MYKFNINIFLKLTWPFINKKKKRKKKKERKKNKYVKALTELSLTLHCRPHQWLSGNAQNWKTGGARFKPRSRLST